MEILKVIKRIFCRHNFEYLGYQKHARKSLWKCEKCGVYCASDYGLGADYHYFDEIPAGDWTFDNIKKLK